MDLYARIKKAEERIKELEESLIDIVKLQAQINEVSVKNSEMLHRLIKKIGKLE